MLERGAVNILENNTGEAERFKKSICLYGNQVLTVVFDRDGGVAVSRYLQHDHLQVRPAMPSSPSLLHPPAVSQLSGYAGATGRH